MLYIYIYKIDNKVIQIEGEIYWEAKSTLQCFSSNEPSSGGMIFVMLNWSTKYKNLWENLYNKKKLDRNPWNNTTVWKLFVLDRNTWYHRTVCKLIVLD